MFHRFDDSIYLYYKINALLCGNNIELVRLFRTKGRLFTLLPDNSVTKGIVTKFVRNHP